MPDIFGKHNSALYDAKVEVYEPPIKSSPGELDGEKFVVEGKEKDLPAGTPPSVAKNINLIVWDKAFYLEWEHGGGNLDNYNVKVEDSSNNEVSLAEGIVKTSITYKDLPGTFPKNGEEYSFVVTTNFHNQSLSASAVKGTASNKTPQNLTKTGTSGDKTSLSWDTVAGDVLGYYVKSKDGDTGEIIGTAGIVTSTSGSFLLPKGLIDVVITAVSLQEIFESSESTALELYSTDPPENFEISVSDRDITATWDDIEQDTDGYNFYRKEQGGTYEKKNSSLITSPFTESGLFNGSYVAYVVPVKSSLEGGKSAEVSFKITGLSVGSFEALGGINTNRVVVGLGEITFTSVEGSGGINSYRVVVGHSPIEISSIETTQNVYTLS